MENIRKYIDYLDSLDLDENEVYIKESECIDAVTNKLLSMNENNQKAYCRVILEFIWSYVYSGDAYSALDDIDNYDIFNDKNAGVRNTISFFFSLQSIFKCFNIDMNQESISLGYRKISPSDIDAPLGYNIQNSRRKKPSTAKTTEQVDVIRTLLKSPGVEYSSDVDLAQFISWLCGGSADSIRVNGLSPNTGYENEEVLKEKFALIGIEYEKGKIKQRTSNL